MANINIGSKFDAKGFKKAETALDKLNSKGRNVARNLGAAFSVTAILAYSKASIKAYAEDEKAAASLGKTLENLGLGFGGASKQVNDYISGLERQTGVLDDELRPAMDRMLRATGSITKSQELLNLALNISAGTGKSLTQVSQSMQKAYLGNTQALGRLGVGLTRAELTSSSFLEIQERLTELFAGQAKTAADGVAGSIAKITVASNNAQEIIGGGLIDALKELGRNKSVDELAMSMENTATYTANVIRGIGLLGAKLNSLPVPSFLKDGFAFGPVDQVFKLIDRVGKAGRSMAAINGADLSPSTATMQSFKNQSKVRSLADFARIDAAKALAKLEKDRASAASKSAAKAAKSDKSSTKSAASKLAAANKIKAIEAAAQKALDKGDGVFDLDKIQNAAALANQAEQLGKATNAAQILGIANDTARLNVKKSMLALEDAISSGNVKQIELATAKLNRDVQILGTLGGQEHKLRDIKAVLESLAPKELINLDNLNSALAILRTIASSSGNGLVVPAVPNNPVTPSIPSVPVMPSNPRAPYNPFGGQDRNYDNSNAYVMPLPSNPYGGSDRDYDRKNQPASDINITVSAGVGDPNAIAQEIYRVLESSANQRGNTLGIGTGSKNTAYIV